MSKIVNFECILSYFKNHWFSVWDIILIKMKINKQISMNGWQSEKQHFVLNIGTWELKLGKTVVQF